MLLNLKKDRYVALGKNQSNALQHKVRGWPTNVANGEGYSSRIDDEYAEALAVTMLHEDILTTEPTLGKRATPVTIPEPTTPLVETALLHTLLPQALPPPRITVTDIYHFICAYIMCRFRQRWHSLESIILRIEARKERAQPNNKLDTHIVRDLVVKHRLLRSFFYAPMNQCLLDSYVLLEFLAKHDIRPSWVFAVTTCPFRAHCWIQHDQTVFNDTPEHAGLHVPIMVV